MNAAAAMPDFYNVLGVDKTASPDEIKKAYRKLSMQHHPDRNQTDTTELFQQISQAYDTLGNPEKKRMYDLQRQGGAPGSFFMNADFGAGPTFFTTVDVDPAELFNMFANMGNFMPPGAKPFNMETLRNNLAKPPPILLTEEITLAKAYNGGTVPLQVTRWIMEQGTRREETETVYLTIPRGVDHNELLILRDKGHVASEQVKGDVKVFIKVKNETCFQRDGLDLHYKKTISLKEALCGFSFDLEHVDGRVFKINNGAGHIVNNTYRKTIPKLGMIREEHNGSLIIEFIVKFPDTLSTEQMDQLRAILPWTRTRTT